MAVSVLFGDDGKITGLEQTWVFDEFYTVYAVEDRDEDGSGKVEPDELTTLGHDMVRNVADVNYFTEVDGKDGRLEFGDAEALDTYMRDDGRLVLVYRLDLAKPVDATDWPITYSIYDPTYYVEMLHLDDTSILMKGRPPVSCRTKLDKPNPKMEMVSLAASLDKMEQGPETLGAQFAERVTIDCRPEDGAGE